MDNTKQGRRINNIFGSSFEEMRAHRKTLWALDVKIHKELFTEEEITKADEILIKARELNKQIEKITKPL